MFVTFHHAETLKYIETHSQSEKHEISTEGCLIIIEFAFISLLIISIWGETLAQTRKNSKCVPISNNFSRVFGHGSIEFWLQMVGSEKVLEILRNF